jgi:biofilm PGA synthesis protein PgaD
MKDLIIDRPSLQTSRQRMLYGSMTLLFWGLWIYLWLPVLGLIGWALGIRIAYNVMVVKNGYLGVVNQLGWYLKIIGILGGSLLFWAYYNLVRFHGVKRRQQVAAPSGPTVHERYGLSALLLSGMRSSRRLEFQHDADGKLIAPTPTLMTYDGLMIEATQPAAVGAKQGSMLPTH